MRVQGIGPPLREMRGAMRGSTLPFDSVLDLRTTDPQNGEAAPKEEEDKVTSP